ncbi:MAG TPA: glycosyltransferase family 2 protein [Patescibacteria group bacterium]|nr:glycosyltransferase family 2 protein [Patescibacteria group bacterium]
MSISVVIVAYNEEKNIRRCLDSVKWADEMIVVDTESIDKTAAIAKKLGAKVFSHPYPRYVEPVRNFSIAKAKGNWFLILDADEEVPPLLAKTLKRLATKPQGASFFRLPRKNIIFGKWIKHSRWWPDWNIRFFKKGAVEWSDKIHSIPLTRGKGKDLEAKESQAIVHYHYQSISQYLERVNRYTDIQLEGLVESGYKFQWPDLIKKPTGEFLSRFFAGEGYKDGLHGLVLALLQAFSEFILYLKIWEKQGFKAEELPLQDFVSEMKALGKETAYWWTTTAIKELKNPLKKLQLRVKRKLS